MDLLLLGGRLFDDNVVKLWPKSKLCTEGLKLLVRLVRDKTITASPAVDKILVRVVFSSGLDANAKIFNIEGAVELLRPEEDGSDSCK